MLGWLKRGWDWWIGGLADGAVRAADRLGSRRRRLRLVRDHERYLLVGPSPRTKRPVTIVAEIGQAPHLEPPESAKAVKGRAVDIELTPATVLVRTLDPLPAESRSYIDGIVRHQLERLTPWLAADTLHLAHVAQVGPADPRLAVTVAATARSLHAPVIAALRAAGAREVRLIAEGPNDTFAIPTDSGAGEITRRKRARRHVLAVLALLLLPAAAGIGMMLWEAQTVGTEAAAIQEIVDTRRRALIAAAGGVNAPAGREVAAMLDRKRATPVAVVALDSLSAALPDDTAVSEMRFDEGRVRITGTSRSVGGLVPLVEATPAFAGAAFFAPTTRLPDGQGDRFHIDARVLSPQELDPSGQPATDAVQPPATQVTPQ